MKKKLIFYGLLHVNNNDSNLNFKYNNKNHKINIYFKNAVLLSKSLKKKNFEFILLTNNKIYLDKINNNKFSINIEQIEFKTVVNIESHFSSCHYRIDLFNYFSKKKHYSALLDLDVVALGQFSDQVKELIDNQNAVIVNDISDNVIPAYGIKKIKKNLEIVLKNKSECKWYGGDLFLGPPEFFKELFENVKFTHENFKINFNNLKDQTDELFMSAAIEMVKKKNKFIVLNSRECGFLDRFWSVNTKHAQDNFSVISKNFLVHFPADKIFLSEMVTNEFSKEFFLNNYDKYSNSIKKKFTNFLSKILN